MWRSTVRSWCAAASRKTRQIGEAMTKRKSSPIRKVLSLLVILGVLIAVNAVGSVRESRAHRKAGAK